MILKAVAAYKGEPTYIFYETLKGFNFRTLASLYNNAPIVEYSTIEPGTNIKDGIIDVFKDLQTIINYEIISNNDNN